MPEHISSGCVALTQAAQHQLQQQLAAAEQLAADVEQLKSENLEAWRVKYELEGQMAATKATLEGLQRQGSSMHKVRTIIMHVFTA
jgi:hypothetical protein